MYAMFHFIDSMLYLITLFQTNANLQFLERLENITLWLDALLKDLQSAKVPSFATDSMLDHS